MVEEKNNIEETVDSIKDYMHTQYELAVLKGVDKAAHFASNFIALIPIVVFSLLSLLILSIGLAFYLNTVLHSEYYGFLIVGGGAFAIVLIVILIRKSAIVKPLRNLMIREVFKNKKI